MMVERLSRGAVRLIATVMLFAGLAALASFAFLASLRLENPALAGIAGIVAQVGAVFMLGGGAANFLSRSGKPLLPNERMAASADQRPPVGGWLLLLAATLVALPLALMLGLQGLLAGWRELLGYLNRADIWQGANANMSGVVLVPLAGALAPALFALGALAMFILASAMLTTSLWVRSPGFPRAYVAWAVLLSAMVFACARSADAVIAAGQALQPLLAAEPGAIDETAALRDGIARYAAIVRNSASVLAWALCAVLVWLPAILFSRRARETFAPDATSPDVASITRHPDARV